jgi:capsular polysaccharide biosynthesis protein
MTSGRSENIASEQETAQWPVEDHHTFEDHYVFPLAKFFRIVWVRWWVVVLVAVSFAAATLGFTLTQPSMYQASVLILVGQNPGLVENPADTEGLEQLTPTLVTAIDSRPVAEDVIMRLDLKMTPTDFLDNLSAEQIPATHFMQVNYKDSKPERARKVANTVAEVFTRRIAGLEGAGSSRITVTVWEEAVTPSIPVSPRPKRNGALALVLGGFAGVCLVFLMEYLDEKSSKPPRRGPVADREKDAAG